MNLASSRDPIPTVEVNDEVLASGHQGRFVVLKVDGNTAELQLFGDDLNSGERVYFDYKQSVPVSTLFVIGKNHQRPPTSRLVR